MKRSTLLAAAGLVVLLAVIRVATDSPDLTSSGTFGAALRLAIPIGLAGLGAIYAERCGIVNIGLEGMMILGTWCGAYGGYHWGPWWGVAFGIAGGALGGLLHAVATVSFGVDHVISGVAINILGAGVTRFLSVVAYEGVPQAGATQSPRVRGSLSNVDLPFLSGGSLGGWRTPDPLGWLEARHWFLISDVGGMLRGLTSNLSLLTIFAVALIPITWWVLWRTAVGLRLRSAGEHPEAAESLGVNVYRMKYLGTVLSGAFAGLGGAFLVLEFSSLYREGQTGGRGFIGLAALIFGNWRPGGVALGAGLFGFADALQLRREDAVHALLLFAAAVLAILAIRAIVRRRWTAAGAMGVAAGAFAAWYLTTDQVASELITFTPHVTTLLVLSAASQRLRPPAADGIPYRRGQAR